MTYNRKYNPEYWRYEGSDICSIGRTALLWAPLKTAFAGSAIAFACFLLYLLGWAFIFKTFQTFATIAIVLGIGGIVLLAVWGIPAFGKVVLNSEAAEVVGEWIAAKNGKFCKKVNVK